MKGSTFLGYTLLLIIFTSCYSFKGTSIPTEVKTFTVLPFENYANNSLPTLPQIFTEQLKDKILAGSRLNYSEEGDVSFKGEITQYRVTAIAPTPGATASLNRLDIEVNVEYSCTPAPDQSWTSKFTRFAEFDSGQDLTSIQEELIDQINTELVEDIFQKAFNNW